MHAGAGDHLFVELRCGFGENLLFPVELHGREPDIEKFRRAANNSVRLEEGKEIKWCQKPYF